MEKGSEREADVDRSLMTSGKFQRGQASKVHFGAIGMANLWHTRDVDFDVEIGQLSGARIGVGKRHLAAPKVHFRTFPVCILSFHPRTI